MVINSVLLLASILFYPSYARKGQLEVQLALKNLNLSIEPVVGYGKIPPAPKPISGRKVGMVPPRELLKIDSEL